MADVPSQAPDVVALHDVTDEQSIREFHRTMLVGNFAPDEVMDSDVLAAGVTYLVVSPALRGRGAGSLVLRTAMDQWTRELAPRLIVGEVEDPRYFDDAGMGDPVARVRLYERMGVRSLPIPYAQPALTPTSARVPHLMLMVFAADDRAKLESGNIDGRIPEQFLTEYFESAEGPSRFRDDEFEAMITACRRAGGLPLLHAAELPEY
jgi:GNAT superfamily N-acetyltransferase